MDVWIVAATWHACPKAHRYVSPSEAAVSVHDSASSQKLKYWVEEIGQEICKPDCGML
jgi:hypothetical protein